MYLKYIRAGEFLILWIQTINEVHEILVYYD